MPGLFENIRRMDDEKLRRITATMEEVTVSGGLNEFGQKLHKGTVKFLNGFVRAFDSKLINEPQISSREERIELRIKELSRISRGELESRLKETIIDKCVSAGLLSDRRNISEDSLYAAITEGALRSLGENAVKTYSHATVANKAEYVYGVILEQNQKSEANRKPVVKNKNNNGKVSYSSGEASLELSQAAMSNSTNPSAAKEKTGSANNDFAEESEYLTGESDSLLKSSAQMINLAMNKDKIIYSHFARLLFMCGEYSGGKYAAEDKELLNFRSSENAFFAARNHEAVREQLKKYNSLEIEKKQLEKSLTDLENRKNALLFRLKEINNERENTKARIISLKHEIRLRSKSVAPVKDNLECQLSRLGEIGELSQENYEAYKAAKSDYDRANDGLAARNNEISALSSKLVMLEHEENDINEQLSDFSGLKEELCQKIEEYNILLKNEFAGRDKMVAGELKKAILYYRNGFERLSFDENVIREFFTKFTYDELILVQKALLELNNAANPSDLALGRGCYEFMIDKKFYGKICIDKPSNEDIYMSKTCKITSIEKIESENSN